MHFYKHILKMFERKEWTADVISLEDNGCKLDLRSFNTGGLSSSWTMSVCSLLWFMVPRLSRCSPSSYIYKDRSSLSLVPG